MNYRHAILLIIAAFLTSCATDPTPAGEVRPVSGSQVIEPSYFRRTDASEIEVLIKRDSGFLGAGSGIIFTINGKPVAKFGAGQGATVYLKPGRYLFGVRPTVDIVTSLPVETDVEVSRSFSQTYRIHSSLGSVHIARSSE